jgi:hypothetical protein
MFRFFATPALALGLMAAAIPVSPAKAATFNMSFTSTGGDIGKLRFDLNGTHATSISGKINGYVVTGLSPYAGSDQQVFMNGPVHFTVPGLSFAASNGVHYNLTAYPDYADRITNSLMDPGGYGNPTPYALTSISVAPVPLPATSVLLAAALGLLGAGRRARKGSPAA